MLQLVIGGDWRDVDVSDFADKYDDGVDDESDDGGGGTSELQR